MDGVTDGVTDEVTDEVMAGLMVGVMGGARQVSVHNLLGFGYHHVFLFRNFPAVQSFSLQFLCRSTLKRPNSGICIWLFFLLLRRPTKNQAIIMKDS